MDADIVIIGSGMGGATMAAGLAPSGRRIVLLERGDWLRDHPDCRDDAAIFDRGVFRSDETWDTPAGAAFRPGNFYYVGGNSKFYGAVMFRYRAEDFGELTHLGGTSPAWPMPYAAFEPWYQKAETFYQVRGAAGQDPTDPPRSAGFPHPPVPDEPSIHALRQRLRAVGLAPFSLPLAVDIDRWRQVSDGAWDGHPDATGAKLDAQSIGIETALRHPNVTLVTGAEVTRLHAGSGGRITRIDYRQGADHKTLTPNLVIMSAGAVNSAALLLRSASEAYPTGLANRSDMVGRRFMNHNCSAVMAIHPLRPNPARYQKTIAFNDFYLRGGPQDRPLGNVQLLGKITAPILKAQTNLPTAAARWIAHHSVDFYAMSEDLPSPDSRVTVKGARIVLDWKRSNWAAHEGLVATLKQTLRRAGYPIVLSRAFDRSTPSHQCGTTVFGPDPATTVLDLTCRAHDHANLYVVDAGFLPSSAAVNPALTIAAQALRVADHIAREKVAA